jgi:hypothetical protein
MEKFGDSCNYIWLTWSCLVEVMGRDVMGVPIITATQQAPKNA